MCDRPSRVIARRSIFHRDLSGFQGCSCHDQGVVRLSEQSDAHAGNGTATRIDGLPSQSPECKWSVTWLLSSVGDLLTALRFLRFRSVRARLRKAPAIVAVKWLLVQWAMGARIAHLAGDIYEYR